MSVCPEKLEIGFPRLRTTWTFLQYLSRAVSRFSRGCSCRKSPSALFRSNWVKNDCNFRSDRTNIYYGVYFSIRSGKVTQLARKSADGDFLQLGPWRSGKQLWIDLGENYKSMNKYDTGNHNYCIKNTTAVWNLRVHHHQQT